MAFPICRSSSKVWRPLRPLLPVFLGNSIMRLIREQKISRTSSKRKPSSMSREQQVPLVLTLDDVSATLERVGGKGASLAQLVGDGLPVPPGFHITTAAYRRFVEEN